MPRPRRWFPFALLPLLAACGDPPPPAAAAPEPTPAAAPARMAPAGSGEVVDGLRQFGAKRIMDLRLTMAASDAGGRDTPFHAAYRPTVRFAGTPEPTEQVCAIRLGDLDAFAPGETHDVTMRCTDAVAFAPEAPGIVLLEDGREVGQGIVLP